jgi:hypothetical protein
MTQNLRCLFSRNRQFQFFNGGEAMERQGTSSRSFYLEIRLLHWRTARMSKSLESGEGRKARVELRMNPPISDLVTIRLEDRIIIWKN